MYHQLLYRVIATRFLKKCFAVLIISTTVLFIDRFRTHFLVDKRQIDVLMVAEMDIDSYPIIPSNYQDRQKLLLDHCNSSLSPSCDISHRAGVEIARRHPLAVSVLFQMQSKSMMYCAVPKVATKTLLTLMLYMNFLDIREHLIRNSTDQTVKKRINLPKLIDELRKQGIKTPKTNDSSLDYIATFVETHLDLFRSDIDKNVSTVHLLNPWRLDLGKAFPQNQLSVLPNLSQIFSPSFTRIMFVRHPFDRLASAYKERIALLEKDRVEPEPDYDKIRRMICLRFTRIRTKQSPSLGASSCDTTIPSFEDFVQYVLQSARVSWARNRLDYHWQPYSMICQVCKFKYNFIGKYETFHDDLNSLLTHLNVSDWNVRKPKGPSGFSTLDYQQMFVSLPNELICGLQILYADDLRLFNYRLEDYVRRPNLTCNKSEIIDTLDFKLSKNRLPPHLDYARKSPLVIRMNTKTSKDGMCSSQI